MKMTKNKQKVLRGESPVPLNDSKLHCRWKSDKETSQEGDQRFVQEEVENYLRTFESASVAQPQPPIVEQQESLVMPITQENLQQSIIQEQESPLVMQGTHNLEDETPPTPKQRH